MVRATTEFRRRPVRCITFALVLAFVAVAATAGWAQERIEVASRREVQPAWARAAVVASLVQYLQGIEIADCEVMTEYDLRLGGPGLCCISPDCHRMADIVDMGLFLGGTFGIATETSGDTVDLKTIRSELAAGRPIMIKMGGMLGDRWMLITGRDGGKVELFDGTRDQFVVPYSQLLDKEPSGLGVWMGTVKILSAVGGTTQAGCWREMQFLPGPYAPCYCKPKFGCQLCPGKNVWRPRIRCQAAGSMVSGPAVN